MSNRGWKAKISHDLVAYGINVVYLTFVFAFFVIYRRLILASYDITDTNYFVSLVQPLILGKVIMVGEVLRFGRGLKDKPLIYLTI